MKIISATDAARSFAEVINRVRYQGEQFEVVRNGEAVARIVPTVPARALTAQEFADLLRNLPPLDEGFAADLLDKQPGAGGEGLSAWAR